MARRGEDPNQVIENILSLPAYDQGIEGNHGVRFTPDLATELLKRNSGSSAKDLVDLCKEETPAKDK